MAFAALMPTLSGGASTRAFTASAKLAEGNCQYCMKDPDVARHLANVKALCESDEGWGAGMGTAKEAIRELRKVGIPMQLIYGIQGMISPETAQSDQDDPAWHEGP